MLYQFWLKKVHFIAKIDIFLNFMLINFLMRTLQCAENLIMYIFAHENMKKTPFSKIAVIFRAAKNSAVCQVSYTWF